MARAYTHPPSSWEERRTFRGTRIGRSRKRLALAEGHLEPVFFDLAVLEKYSTDPHYRFDWHDYNGSSGLTDKHYRSADLEPGTSRFGTRNSSIFLRPTLRNYETFAHVLDKKLSDNVDEAFIQGRCD
jgi:hypothetical protein